jgi:hypothetical protein
MMEKYMHAYQPQVHAMPGPEEWPDVDGCDEVLSPSVRVQPGHPKKARRRAPPDEPTNPYKISSSEYVVTCGNCGGQVYNYKDCHLPLNPNRKRWNPKKRKTSKVSVICFYSSIAKFNVNNVVTPCYVLGIPK